MPAVRRIWLCADDYGISTAVNTAIRDLVVRGRLNATSVMTAAPAFSRSEAVALDLLNSGDAKRVVDFAAGLIFGLRGSIDRVSNRVFLLTPADTEIINGEPSAHRSDGFFNQS